MSGLPWSDQITWERSSEHNFETGDWLESPLWT